MRALVLAAFAVAAGCDLDASSGALKPPATPAAAPARAQAAAQARARDDCRDACEQNAILAQTGDAALRACRSSCDGRYGGAAAGGTNPYEAPSKITRAPAQHHPPAVRPR